jgi:hypothetical protein
VDKTGITHDDTLTYKVTVTSSDRNLPPPQIPEFKGFYLLSQAQSSTLSFVKNEIKTVLEYTFILAPTDVGKFRIEPSTIKIKNKVYSSESFDIEVTQGKTKPQPKPEEKPGLPEELQPESEEPQITL